MSDNITLERETARELARILRYEVEQADEIHQTENTMAHVAGEIETQLEQ